MNLPIFKNGIKCRKGCANCRACRSDHQQEWRINQTGESEFPCPFEFLVPEKKVSKICFRAILNLENVKKAMGDILARQKIDENTRSLRLDACQSCDMRCSDKDGDFCGAGCGCGIGGARPIMMRVAKVVGIDADLTAYSEKNGALCKHPQRHAGKGWPLK